MNNFRKQTQNSSEKEVVLPAMKCQVAWRNKVLHNNNEVLSARSQLSPRRVQQQPQQLQQQQQRMGEGGGEGVANVGRLQIIVTTCHGNIDRHLMMYLTIYTCTDR